MSINNVLCASCREILTFETLSKDEPCPNCGSSNREFIEQLACKIEVGILIDVKHKRPGKKKPIFELREGKEYFKTEKKLVTKTRIFDREKNKYHEIVKDARTGRIIRECDESLSKHTGHGSAKPK